MISDLIDSWRKEIEKMLPPALRGLSFMDFIGALVKPIQTVSDEVVIAENEIRIRLKYQGQIMVLQASLNEIFAVTAAPFIRVETNQDPAATPSFVYAVSDGIPTMSIEVSGVTAYISPDPTQSNTIPDFRVLIPVGIWTQDLEDKIRDETQLYKIAGKLFEIITY